jgi:hypothetical protein
MMLAHALFRKYLVRNYKCESRYIVHTLLMRFTQLSPDALERLCNVLRGSTVRSPLHSVCELSFYVIVRLCESLEPGMSGARTNVHAEYICDTCTI